MSNGLRWLVLLGAVFGGSGCIAPHPGGARRPAAWIAEYRLGADARLRRTNDTWYLSSGPRTLRLPVAASGPCRLVQALQSEWLTWAQMEAVYRYPTGSTNIPTYPVFVEQLRQQRLLAVRIKGEGEESLYTIDPAPSVSEVAAHPPAAGGPYRLSRFAYLHAANGGLQLESPLTGCRIMCHAPEVLRVLSRLCDTNGLQITADDCAGGQGESGSAVKPLFLAHLIEAGFVEPVAGGPGPDSPALARWEFHDLLFHARSSPGEHGQPLGGTYRWKGVMPAPPVTKPPMSTNVTVLPRPDAAARRKLGRAFDGTLEARRSVREQKDPPITAAELGAFLHTAARIEKTEDSAGDDGISYRPSPSGGARHPLEIYVLVRRCDGLGPGLYHYGPGRHQLERIETGGPRWAELMAWNPFEAWGYAPPQVMLLIAARYLRTAWKYEGLAYRLIQNDLGCLEQTLYLTATALDLAPCAIGSADPGVFAAVTGLDPYEEPLLAAFTLGRK